MTKSVNTDQTAPLGVKGTVLMCLTVYTACPDLSFQKLKNIMVTFKFVINNTIKTKNHNYTIFGHLTIQNSEGNTFETIVFFYNWDILYFGIEKQS